MARKPAPAKTPTVALVRVLKSLGMTNRGIDRNFRIFGHYNSEGERLHTLAVIFDADAERLAAEHADDIERLTRESGFPFRVAVRVTCGRLSVSIGNGGSVTSVREWSPADDQVDEPAGDRADDQVDEPAGDRADELMESSRSTVTLSAILRRRTGSDPWWETGRRGVCEALVRDGVTLDMIDDLNT